VDLYPKVLVQPICGCCGHPMILGRLVAKYQSFFCINASSGIKGCTNRGYKSARIVDEAVLRTVKATLERGGADGSRRCSRPGLEFDSLEPGR
jgi:hypothetical protein